MIETRSLQFEYPRGPRLTFPDIRVAQGERLLLQGRSGAGKSTWLALVAGLRTAASGDIAVAGQSLGALSGAARDAWRARSIGFLPQKLHLSDALTVRGNLALNYYAAGLREDARRIHEVLEWLGVGELAQRRPAQLSGGQAQRVALARSVLLSPQLLLADEPTASLDDEAASAALRLLEDAAARCGATLVIATHDSRVRDAFPSAQVYRLGETAEAGA